VVEMIGLGTRGTGAEKKGAEGSGRVWKPRKERKEEGGRERKRNPRYQRGRERRCSKTADRR
jgi:hypothetical protein